MEAVLLPNTGRPVVQEVVGEESLWECQQLPWEVHTLFSSILDRLRGETEGLPGRAIEEEVE